MEPQGQTAAPILVVDDSATQAELVKLILEAEGYEVVTAANGQEGFAAAKSRIPQLVISDVMMPLMDGYQLCKAIKSNETLKHIPVLLLTSLSDPSDIIKGLDSGAENFITKPVDETYLISRVKYMLLNRELSEAERLQVGVSVLVGGKRHFITSDRQQILHLLIATFETVVRQNQELLKTQEELRSFNEDLEDRVKGRTTDLQDEIALRKKVEESLRIAKNEAEQANRLKDDFLATLSHELRSPINVIMGYADLLSNSKGYPKALEEVVSFDKAVGAILRNAKLQARLVSDLLDVSRIVSGNITLSYKTVVLADVVKENLEALAAAVQAKRLQIHSNLSNPGMILGDQQRLNQVIWHLLSNAIKFSAEGGHIWLNLDQQGEYCSLEIRDEGCGIEAEFLPHVFDRFRQEDSSRTRRHGGLGLGLSIVKHVIELHSGEVKVTSAGHNKGSTFRIILPIEQAIGRESGPEENKDHLVVIESERRFNAPSIQGMKVLVVDDAEDIQALVGVILRSAGAEVIAVSDARAALQAITNLHPDALISDIGMPDIDGYELIRQVRRLEGRCARVAAIALTAFASEDERHEALRAGYQLHVAKPVDPKRLVAAVAKLAKRYNQPTEEVATL